MAPLSKPCSIPFAPGREGWPPVRTSKDRAAQTWAAWGSAGHHGNCDCPASHGDGERRPSGQRVPWPPCRMPARAVRPLPGLPTSPGIASLERSMRLSTSVAFLVCATWASVAPAQSVWARPAPIYGLTGGVDVLAAATAGGVVLWDLPSGRTRHVTTAEGLPTHLALAASFAPDTEVLGVATANGIA